MFASSSNLDITDGAQSSATVTPVPTPVPTPSFNLAQDDFRTFFEFSDGIAIRDEPPTPLDVTDGHTSYITPTFEHYPTRMGQPAVM